MALLGLDIGTSGCKATLADLNGQVISQAYQEYPLYSDQPGWQEIDPEQVWTAVRAVISQAVGGRANSPVRAISVSSFGEAVVAIDESGRTLGRSMIYIDIRGREEAGEISARLSDDRVLAITGTTVQSMYSLCKIRWLKKNRPEIYAQTWKFLLFADFILYRLGAPPATDYSLAARTLAFDIREKVWSDVMLSAAEIDQKKFGEPVQAGTPLGTIKPALAAELGLPSGIMLVAGGHDQPCAALGAGVIYPGLAVDGLGTTECITPTFAEPILSKAMADNYFACVPHVIPDHYVTYAFTFTSGSILKWYRDQFGAALRAEADELGVNVYDLMIDRARQEPSSLLVLPHFAGAATPFMDTASTGAIIGLTIDTRPDDIVKGLLEGITFEIMLNSERLAQAGVPIREILAVGGLSRSDTYLQLKASMMGKPVTTLKVAEAGTMGVIILAGTASGVFSGIGEAVDRLVRRRQTFEPDMLLHDFYQQRFTQYKKLYPALTAIRA